MFVLEPLVLKYCFIDNFTWCKENVYDWLYFKYLIPLNFESFRIVGNKFQNKLNLRGVLFYEDYVNRIHEIFKILRFLVFYRNKITTFKWHWVRLKHKWIFYLIDIKCYGLARKPIASTQNNNACVFHIFTHSGTSVLFKLSGSFNEEEG